VRSDLGMDGTDEAGEVLLISGGAFQRHGLEGRVRGSANRRPSIMLFGTKMARNLDLQDT